MDLKILDKKGGTIETIVVDDSVFNITPNEDVIYRAVQSEMTNLRHGTHSTKVRSEVSGSGKKPWKQKKTGRARVGSTRSPIWKGGAVVFGPRPHPYHYDLPKKMRRLARKSVLSQKAKDGDLFVVDQIVIDKPRTKELIEILNNLGLTGKKVLYLPKQLNRNVYLSLRNLHHVTAIKATSASTYDIINSDVLLFDKDGIEDLNNQLRTEAS